MKRREFLRATGAIAALGVTGCQRENGAHAGGRVTVYCSVDDVYARPILAAIEKRTGLQVLALYDTEAAKTAGLANKLRAEKTRPRGDVFWSSALLQTLLLAREGLLQTYQSPSAQDLPEAVQDKAGLWAAVGVRERVIVAHESVKNPPRSLEQFLDNQWRGKIGISNPQFGTASDWVAALGVRWGLKKTRAYFERLKHHGAQIVAGNSVVAQRVARGELLAGVTDRDDYLATQAENRQLKLVEALPPREINSIVVPGCAAIIKGAPHVDAAQKFVDALLSSETENLLTRTMPGVTTARAMANFSLTDDTAQWADAWDNLRDPLAEILLK